MRNRVLFRYYFRTTFDVLIVRFRFVGKLCSLIGFLEDKKPRKVMLFLPTCATVDYWADVFPSVLPPGARLPVMAIHGKMKEKRKRVMEKFRRASEAVLLCTDVLARGIDVPEVDWVVQWDPPASAAAFVHRVGRTARQGAEGRALIFLLPSEEAYVDFIERNQRVKLIEIKNSTEPDRRRMLESVRWLQMADRGVMDKANRAFVSHVRAYSKHECSLLFRVKDLPLAAMANGYALLQLPKMPEFKHAVATGFTPVDSLDLNAIPYKDRQKEAVRLKKLEEYRNCGRWPGRRVAPRKQTEAWSRTRQNKVERQEKRAKRKAKRARDGGPAKKRKKGISEEDMKELAEDIALLRKLKRKKITEAECDERMGLI